MKKLFFLFILTLLISQCGYERIYSGKNLGISIKNIKKENNFINNELSSVLLEKFDEPSDNPFNLEIQSNKSTDIKSKDSKGNASVYVLKLETKIIAKNKTDKEYTKIFYEEMNYNNNDDKFELSQYIKQIEKVLIKETVEEIISYLIDIK